MSFTLGELMHEIGMAFRNPCLAVLFILLGVAVWQVGDMAVELIAERRKLRVDIPEMIHSIHNGGKENIEEIIENSALLRRQKNALLIVVRADNLPKGSTVALAQRQISVEDERCEKMTAPTDLVAKLGPMFGLLGTLIPLGPGIVALGEGDTATLSSSLGMAFDTTIIGLISAAIAYVISNIRKRWYEDDMSMLETLMEAVLEEVTSDAR